MMGAGKSTTRAIDVHEDDETGVVQVCVCVKGSIWKITPNVVKRIFSPWKLLSVLPR